MSSSISPSFTAGGLASGLDTNSIIDGFVKLASQPITTKQTQQSAIRSQVSLLGQISASLADFGTAADALGSGNALAVKLSSSPTAYSATVGAGAGQGNYSIQVQALASAAKARSAAFASSDAPVRGGTLAITVQGTAYNVTIADGTSLADTASAIRASGAPVNVSVLNDGTNSYLSITNQNTGYTLGQAPASALSIVETSTGSAGQPLGAAVFQQATNAAFTIDGLAFKRTSNLVSDAIAGTTLALKTAGGPAEDLVLANDVAGTADKLNGLVKAYNNVIGQVQKQLDVAPGTDRTRTLAGDGTIRSLQARLQALVSAVVPGTGSVRTLADLGVKTERDGTLSLNSATLAAAIAREPGAVNALFSTATSGISTLAKGVSKDFTDPISGALTSDTNGLNGRIGQLDKDIAILQDRVATYKKSLVAQFTAMENVVSGLKSLGTLLNSIGSATSSSK